jgi:hypothetical protein
VIYVHYTHFAAKLEYVHYATNWKIAGSIPVEVIGFFI